MQSKKYTLQDLKNIINIFRDVYGVEDDPHPHDYQILTYFKYDYECASQIISKYTKYSHGDLMFDYLLDVLFVVKYESLPLWVNQGVLLEKLAAWRINYGS